MSDGLWSRRTALRAAAAAGTALIVAPSSHPGPQRRTVITPGGAFRGPLVPVPGVRYDVVISQGMAIVVGNAGPPAGPAIVLVHGGLVAHDWWRAQLPTLLARGYRVVLPDMPGHGGSDPMPHSLADPYLINARVVADVIDTLHLDQALVVGWSAGALGVLRGLGPGNPLESRAAGVLVVGGFARHAPLVLQHSLFPALVPALVRQPAGFVDACLRPDIDLIPGSARAEVIRSTAPDTTTLARLIAAALTADLSSNIDRTTVPVTVAHGTHDHVVRHRGAQDLADLAGTALRTLPGGHATFLTRPAAFDTVLLDAARGVR